MENKRRTVLKGALASTAFLIPSGLLDAFDDLTPVGVDAPPIGTSTLTRARFGAHVGSDFVVQTRGGSTLMLRLVSVDDVPNAAAGGVEGAEDTFVARFEDWSGILLSQGTYTVSHDSLGRLRLFIVPVGQPTARAQSYEAVFHAAPAGAPKPPTPRRREPAAVTPAAVEP